MFRRESIPAVAVAGLDHCGRNTVQASADLVNEYLRITRLCSTQLRPETGDECDRIEIRRGDRRKAQLAPRRLNRRPGAGVLVDRPGVRIHDLAGAYLGDQPLGHPLREDRSV